MSGTTVSATRAGMLRTEAVEILAAARGDMLSVVTMQPVATWNALGQADDRNFDVVGCMGSAASIGLGLALARPADRVLVIDGDGSLLMQLASLVSVAEQRPRNLYHVVFENGIYETSGGQPVPGHGLADLVGVATASGYRHAVRFHTAAELGTAVEQTLRLEGPVLVSLRISGPGVAPGSPRPRAADKPTQIQNMRAALAGTR
ncbi:thiamine pyrophosphate-dependent enzyme [Pseudonocardia dioxanivorans]|jgi:phosphonopyruvate decarboxylase|uniref:thiamine pyrophosphate-dependent enzyme n=1 Tax=Pseudonocardia dioxanivorans TaxID=240495 RepID=UPI000CCFF274|nr:thiamine pyrophosphate-dependent enzyme [Pseudonocardia dioxanivorans]